MLEICRYFMGLLSGFLPLTALLFCGIYITVNGRFFQFTRFFESVRLIRKALLEKKGKNKGITSLQSACTALSATVGTGNIAGVAGAVSIGGAGAVFWMWLSAFLGMAVKYCEIALAVKYREKSGNEFVGGPMYYIKSGFRGVGSIWAVIFAVAAIPAVFCTGNITQVNAAVLSIGQGKGVRIISGIVFTLLTAAVVGGGMGRIGSFTEKIVPIMSVVYTLLTLAVIAINYKSVPAAFLMIFKGAFKPFAVTGGAIGSMLTAVITGASHGVFSNEAGLGTSAMAHSAAVDAKPDTQGLFGIFEVFLDTVLICTLTALTILCSGVKINYGSMASCELVSTALTGSFGGFSHYLLAVMMCVFAFSSVVGWAFYGNICFSFLFGDKGKRFFTAVYPCFCLAGALFSTEIAWRIAELFNGIMLCINLPIIMILFENLKLKRNKDDRKKNKKNCRNA